MSNPNIKQLSWPERINYYLSPSCEECIKARALLSVFGILSFIGHIIVFIQ